MEPLTLEEAWGHANLAVAGVECTLLLDMGLRTAENGRTYRELWLADKHKECGSESYYRVQVSRYNQDDPKLLYSHVSSLSPLELLSALEVR